MKLSRNTPPFFENNNQLWIFFGQKNSEIFIAKAFKVHHWK